MIDSKTAVVLAIAGGIILLVAVVSFVLLRRRRNIWQRFARRHGCSYRELTPHGFEVKGQIDGRNFLLATEEKSSDTGALGIEEVTMSLEIRGQLPAGLFLQKSPGMLGEVQRALEEKETPTGDEQFDHGTVYTGDDSKALLAYATPERRREFLELIADTGSADVQLLDGKLMILDREMVARLELLEHWLAELRAATPAFDVK